MLRALVACRRTATATDTMRQRSASEATARFIARTVKQQPQQARTLWTSAPATPTWRFAACASCLSAAAIVRGNAPRRFLSTSSERAAAVASSPAAAAAAAAAAAPTASSMYARIRSCMSRGHSDRASALLAEFEQRGGRCDTTLLNLHIGSFAVEGDWEGAERVWARFAELGLKPNSLSYRNLCKVYTRSGSPQQLAKIDGLLAEMHRTGLAFTAGELAFLRMAAQLCKLPDEVRRWDQLSLALARARGASPRKHTRSASSSSPPSPADPATLYSQLKLCLLNGDTVRASQAVRDFEAAGGRCDLAILTLWIITHIPSGDWRSADRVWARMGELGLRPDCVAYASLIQVCLRSGDEQRARIDGLLIEMRRAGITFTNTGYEQLLLSAHALKLPQEVRRWSEHARKARRLHLLSQTVRNIAAEAADSAPAVALEGAGLNGDTRSSSPRRLSAILAKKVSDLSSSGNAAAAERLVLDSVARGLALDVGVLNAWIGCFRKNGDWLGAEGVWRRMMNLKILPTNVSYCNLILVYLQNGTKEQLAKIDPLLSKMQRQGLRFTSRDYQQVIETFHACKLTNRMQQWSTHSSAAALFGRASGSAVLAATGEERKKQPATAPEQQSADVTAPASSEAAASAPSSPSPPLSDRDVLLGRLRSLVRRGYHVRAGQAVRRFEQKGGVLDAELVNAWLSSHQTRADWKGAERVWARMHTLKLEPSSACYVTLIRTYMKTRDELHLAKIDPLLASMQATPDLQFTENELTSLLNCALLYGLPNEMHRWTFRAPARSVYVPSPRARSTPAPRVRAFKTHSDANSSRRSRTALVPTSGRLRSAPQRRAYHRSASAPRSSRADAAAASSPPSSISSSSSASSPVDPADAAAAVARAELDRVVVSESVRDAKAQAARRKHAARQRDRKAATEERGLFLQHKSKLKSSAPTASPSSIGPVAVPFTSATLALVSSEDELAAPSTSSASLAYLTPNPLDLKSSIHVSTFRRLLQKDKSVGSVASDAAFDLALKTSGHEEWVDGFIMESALQSVLTRLQRDHVRAVTSDPALLERANMIWREAKSRKLLSAELVHTLLQCYSARGNGYNAPAQLDLLSEAVALEPELQRDLRVGAVKPVLVLAKSYTLALRSMVVAFQQEGVLTQPAQFAEAQKIGREIFAQLLHRISSQRMFSDLVSSWSEWRSLLSVLRTLKLYDLVRGDAWRTMREQQDQEVSKWREHRVQQGLEAQSVPTLMRMPSKILTLLVHCAVEEHGGLVGVRTAQSLIADLQRPETIDRFEAPGGTLLAALLEAYSICPNPDLAELRAMYDAIDPKDAESHAIMLQSYCAQRQLQEASQLCAVLEAQPTPDVATIVAILTALAEIVASQQSDLAKSAVHRAEALWTRVKADPAKLASADVTRAMLNVILQRRDGKRCIEIMAEALQTESAAPPVSSSAGRPVFVDALAYSVLFNTCAQSSEPKLFEAEAARAFEELKARHAEAVKQGRKARAAALEMQPVVRDSYTRFRQRCNPASYPSLELLRATPARAQTTHSFVLPLHELADAGDVSGAEALIAEFEASKKRWSVDLLAAWIGVYRASADCAAAEKVWQRISDLGLAPNAAALGALMQVYMSAGTAASLSKLDDLSSRASSLPRLRAKDLDHLIFASARCNLPTQVAALANRAKDTQMWAQLNPKALRVVARNERKMQRSAPAATVSTSSVTQAEVVPQATPAAAAAPVVAHTPPLAAENVVAAPSSAAVPVAPAAPIAVQAAAAAPSRPPVQPSSVPSATASRLLRAGNALQEAMVVASSLSTRANPAELTGRIWLKLHLRALDAVEAFVNRVTGGR